MNRPVIGDSGNGWDETKVAERTETMIDALLETWPVPAGHEGKTVDRSSRFSKATTPYADLISAGLIDVGATLVCTDERWTCASRCCMRGVEPIGSRS